MGKVKARVTADLDFTQVEQAREYYDPDTKTLRSVQSEKESSPVASAAGGVPGSTSNQAPATKEAESPTPLAPAGNESKDQFVKKLRT